MKTQTVEPGSHEESMLRALMACHVGRVLHLNRIPLLETRGKAILRPILEALGLPPEPNGPPHSTDAEVRQMVELLIPRREHASFTKIAQRLETNFLEPPDALQRLTIYSGLSVTTTTEIVAHAVREGNISLRQFHCVFATWLVLRAQTLGILVYLDGDFLHI